MDTYFIHSGSINNIRDKFARIESSQISNSISLIRTAVQLSRPVLQADAQANIAMSRIFQELGTLPILVFVQNPANMTCTFQTLRWRYKYWQNKNCLLWLARLKIKLQSQQHLISMSMVLIMMLIKDNSALTVSVKNDAIASYLLHLAFVLRYFNSLSCVVTPPSWWEKKWTFSLTWKSVNALL